jgi:DNA-binding XRE family transcriptional regulator
MSVQIITSHDVPVFAVVPFEEWQKLQARLEEMEDIADARTISSRFASGEDESFPDSFVERLLAGENPLKVWREYRGVTIAALAAACKVSAPAVSQIESGRRHPSAGLLKRLAAVLKCDMEDLLKDETVQE